MNAMEAQEYYEQGFDLGRKGLYKEASEAFTQAINLNPDFVEAYMIRANTRAAIGDLRGGIEDFEKAMDIYRARGQSQIADMLLVSWGALHNELRWKD
jgi:tetratricopeptide (TPR) repeat protein